jgi:hypothetical protein
MNFGDDVSPSIHNAECLIEKCQDISGLYYINLWPRIRHRIPSRRPTVSEGYTLNAVI